MAHAFGLTAEISRLEGARALEGSRLKGEVQRLSVALTGTCEDLAEERMMRKQQNATFAKEVERLNGLVEKLEAECRYVGTGTVGERIHNVSLQF